MENVTVERRCRIKIIPSKDMNIYILQWNFKLKYRDGVYHS